VFYIGDRRTGKLTFECLAVGDASTQELRPGRNCHIWIGLLGKQVPELRMVPAEVPYGAVDAISLCPSSPPSRRARFRRATALLRLLVQDGDGVHFDE
jgi:hypothetical protein